MHLREIQSCLCQPMSFEDRQTESKWSWLTSFSSFSSFSSYLPVWKRWTSFCSRKGRVGGDSWKFVSTFFSHPSNTNTLRCTVFISQTNDELRSSDQFIIASSAFWSEELTSFLQFYFFLIFFGKSVSLSILLSFLLRFKFQWVSTLKSLFCRFVLGIFQEILTAKTVMVLKI